MVFLECPALAGPKFVGRVATPPPFMASGVEPEAGESYSYPTHIGRSAEAKPSLCWRYKKMRIAS